MTLVFNVKSLDLSDTIDKENKDSLTLDKTQLFFDALSKTSLRTSLTKITTNDIKFPKNELATMVKNFGLKAAVVEDDENA
mmetsp:Transcript_17447/g.20265  ORF Transcript_17447/g.20265 Transcript_17447/m.20265 type:complete len:81 (+) Transcript_17447:509-751(+)|eukprot:CAMPEP_0168337512 /NCGR_PEP_ID=MMETSP0213-20121227/12236_1 /TAXON_ID=151035 /ORGANISM="Euplotes harpa, Strain FSP1.4" /LENGTH=80 /DNA_ID=CAMNT_0008343019 /DNA_START=498 /DNA_END=740 /DNA_ORIENTATION=+